MTGRFFEGRSVAVLFLLGGRSLVASVRRPALDKGFRRSAIGRCRFHRRLEHDSAFAEARVLHS